MQKWVFGSYTLRSGPDGPKVHMNAAIGLVEWETGEGIKEVLARADALMYKQKAELHKRSGAAPGTRLN
jgi:PleD family two-component response regulator